MQKVSIILPCYNEEECLPLYFASVDPVIKNIEDFDFEFVLVDDGSKDRTLEVMNELYMTRDDIVVVKESRNYGQNAALTAGLVHCRGDYAIMMDVDLQDPVELIKSICEKFTEGYEIVNPHRASRKEDSWFKRTSAGIFYSFVNKLEGKEVIPENVNCFRGLSRRAIDAINALPEKDRFYVSLVPLVGFKTCTLDFVRQKREAGKSKYSLKKLFTHSFNLISTTTDKPLYFPIKFGFISSCLTFICAITFLILTLCFYFSAKLLKFYPIFEIFTIIFFVLFSVSLVIFFIGIISIYLHNILINTRNRPNTFVDLVKTPEEKEKER